jgi:hypothetical protein
LKKLDAWPSSLFNYVSRYAIKGVQANQEDLKINGTHQLLVYADDVIMSGGHVSTVKQNTEPLIVASKGIGLEVNSEKTKYMVMSREQNGGQNRNIKLIINPSENVGYFKYLGTTLTNLNFFREEIKSRSKSCMFASIRHGTFCLPGCCSKV